MGKLFITDDLGKEHMLEFQALEYRSVMDLIFNELWIEWGDCRGRAMCGTCHIEILEGDPGEKDADEAETLENLPNNTSRSRLACQMTVDDSIDNMKLRILKDY